ncbi:MAG: DUF3857 domain-containing protein [Bacteroidales bacterium]|nr:DUF3857 domain-containing protein [Bacteroidales bacterium]
MKRFLIVLSLALFPVVSSGQDSAADILESRESFKMRDVSSGTYTVYSKIRINKESASSAGLITIFTDSDRSLSSFSATITNSAGKVIKKLHRQDLESRALARELADDSFVYFYRPLAPIPYIVEYEYTISYKRGVPAFPTYFPVMAEDVRLEKGEYAIEVPSGTKIQYSSTVEPEVAKEDFKERYIWRFTDYQGFEDESTMPPIKEIVPNVSASPVNFMFSKVEGQQGSWKDIGLWLYDLQKDTWDLSEQDKAKILEMTSGCANTYEKVKVLYDHLRNTTRYVSIQLGIGGYKPFPASTVAKTGFGDCKALSNYMKAMLEVVGVESDYFILNTNRADLDKGYCSVGSMNHAMLAVPLKDGGAMQGDTLWVECTNPSVPLGYRHEDVAGHQVLLVKKDGGDFIRCPRYPDSLSRLENKVRLFVASTGDATVNVRQRACLDFVESRLRLYRMDDKEKSERVAKNIAVTSNNPKINQIKDNFQDYPLKGREYVPEMVTDYSVECRNYAESNGDRLFIPLTPLRSQVEWQRGTRKNDIYIESGSVYLDSVEINVPVTYEPEGLPKPVNMECKFASFSSTVKTEGSKVIVVLKTVFKAGRYPKEDYAEYRTAARKFNSLCTSKLVFRRKQ